MSLHRQPTSSLLAVFLLLSLCLSLTAYAAQPTRAFHGAPNALSELNPSFHKAEDTTTTSSTNDQQQPHEDQSTSNTESAVALSVAVQWVAPPTYLAGLVPGADNFAKCLCFQSNGAWCFSGENQNSTNASSASNENGGSGDWDAFWNRDVCQHWLLHTFLWTIPAVAALLFLFVYPIVLFSARMCCNCCGGREPTDGCCCPRAPEQQPQIVYVSLAHPDTPPTASAEPQSLYYEQQQQQQFQAPPSSVSVADAGSNPYQSLHSNSLNYSQQQQQQQQQQPLSDLNNNKKKEYGNREICITKTFFVTLFALTVYYSVAVYTSNDNLHYDIIHSTIHIQQKAWGLVADVDSAENVFEALTNETSTWDFTTPPTIARFTTALQNAESPLRSVANSIQDAMVYIRKYESQEQFGRSEDAYRIPSMLLMVLFPLLFLCMCNCRGAPWTIASGLFAWVGVLIVASFIFHTVIAETSTSLCDEYNTTLVPSLMNAAEWAGGCGGALSSPLDDFFISYNEYLCNNTQQSGNQKGPLTTLCQGNPNSLFDCSQDVLTFVCPLQNGVPLDNITNGWMPMDGVLFWQYQFANATLLLKTIASNVNAGCGMMGGEGCSIAQCASECTNAQAREASQALVQIANTTFPLMQELASNFYTSYVNCSGINTALRSDEVYDLLCHSLSTRLTNMALVFLALSFCALFGTIILLLSAKRMTKFQRTPLPPPPPPPSSVNAQEGGGLPDGSSIVSMPLLAPANNANENSGATPVYGTVLQTNSTMSRGTVASNLPEPSRTRRQQEVMQLAIDVLFNGDRQQAESVFGTPIAYNTREDLERQLYYPSQGYQQQQQAPPPPPAPLGVPQQGPVQ